MDGGNDPTAGHRWYPGEADDDAGSFVHMFGGTSDDDVPPCHGGGGATGQPELVSSCPAIPERCLPPSESVMAAWLYPIVSGQGRAADKAPMAKEPATTTTESGKGKLPATDAMFGATKDTNSSEKKKAPGGSSSSRKGSATHSITEKRRRCRIAEKLRTLKQLVPGCDNKSSQASTLDQTIQYMKSLQQQVQTMSTGWQAPPAAVYPVVQTMPPPAVAMAMPPAATSRPGVVPMVPVGAMLPYPHYHALMMPAADSAAPQYPPTTAGASAAVPDAAGEHAQCSVSTEHEQHQHKEK